MSAASNPVVILQPRVRLADPHDCTDEKDVLTILNAVYETLVTRSARGGASALAASWTVSEDARLWRFTLREGAIFHDGSPCDAEAVALSLRRMARPDKGYTLGSPGVWHQYLGGADIRAEGAARVMVRLREPVADLLDILAQGFIAAPSMIEQLDSGREVLPCGSGPYRVLSAKEGEVRAQKVEGHPSAPSAPDVLWRAEPDAELRRAAVAEGRAEVATALPCERGESAPGVTTITHENPVAIIYLLNAARGPLKDPRLRAALDLAIDRDALIAEVRGGAALPLHAIMPSLALGAGQRAARPPDPGKARALIAEAGFADLTLRLDCPTRLPDEAEALTAALQRQLRPLGIALDVTLHHDREAYAHMVRRKEIGDLCVFDSSPISTFRVLYEKIDARVRGSWWQGYHNADVETLIDLARREVSLDRREGLYAEIIARLRVDPPWLTLYTPLQSVAIAGNHPGLSFPADGVLDVSALPGRP